jgi:hypothetical protein
MAKHVCKRIPKSEPWKSTSLFSDEKHDAISCAQASGHEIRVTETGELLLLLVGETAERRGKSETVGVSVPVPSCPWCGWNPKKRVANKQ